MKKLWLLLLVLQPVVGVGQVITTFAGNGTSGSTGDGSAATLATFSQPFACAFDSHGNLYVTEVVANKIRKINISGIISSFAGGGSSLGDGGPATMAQLYNPTGIAIDANNNVYVVDNYKFRVRRIDAITGIITTIAGNGLTGYSGDNGPASASVLGGVNGICIDGLGNIYLTDVPNNRIRKINTAGIISTFAGNGLNGNTGDGGPATNAQIALAIGICADESNNIYFVQSNTIRRITPSGIISTFAGNGSGSTTGDGEPATAAGIAPYLLVSDNSGGIYLSGYVTNIVRRINSSRIIQTVAGKGTAAYAGDGGPATAASLHTPIGIAVDKCNNLYIAAREEFRIRKVTFNPSCNPTLETEQIKPLTEISIYPNPASTELTISAPGKIKEVGVYDLLGRIVGTYPGHSKGEEVLRISVAGLSPGIYFVRIVDEGGGVVVRRVVKE